MSTPYERLIDFCKAEVVSPTKSWVEVRDKGAYFSIYFRRLAWLAEVRKPSEADNYNKTRQRDVLYEDRPKWNDLCEMLGLNSPWIAFDKNNPPPDGSYLVSAGMNVWESYIKDGVSWVGRVPCKELSPFSPIYYMPLPAPPID